MLSSALNIEYWGKSLPHPTLLLQLEHFICSEKFVSIVMLTDDSGVNLDFLWKSSFQERATWKETEYGTLTKRFAFSYTSPDFFSMVICRSESLALVQDGIPTSTTNLQLQVNKLQSLPYFIVNSYLFVWKWNWSHGVF